MNTGLILALAATAFLTRHQWMSPNWSVTTVRTDITIPAPPRHAPELPMRHLAPEGIFYMVEYSSVRTNRGIVGFQPGLEVRLMGVNKENGTLTVSDGQYAVEVGPMQITNDLDIAALARRRDRTPTSRRMIERRRAGTKATRKMWPRCGQVPPSGGCTYLTLPTKPAAPTITWTGRTCVGC